MLSTSTTPVHPPAGRRLPAALALAALLLLQASAVEGRSPRLEPRLAGFYADWLASVDHLLSERERQVFLALEHDVHRELFIRRFWEAHDAGAEGDHTLLARWQENFDQVGRRFRSRDDDRARALMIAGKPPRVTRVECDRNLRRLEIWSYDDWHARFQSGRDDRRGFLLLFYLKTRLDYGDYRHWSPADGTAVLLAGGGGGRGSVPAAEVIALGRQGGCLRHAATRELLAAALDHALGVEELRRHLAPPPPAAGWLERLQAELAVTRPSAAALPAAPLEVRYPGRYNDQRTILEGRVAIPAEVFDRTAEGQLFDRVVISGDVYAGDRLADAFRVVHYLAGAEPVDGIVRLSFFRRLRPGTYLLKVRVADGRGLGLLRDDRAVDVPRLSEDAVAPPLSRLGFATLTRGDVGVLATLPSVELMAPAADLLVGPVELTAVTTGGPIARLDFLLDGVLAAVDDRPPFAVTVDLGPTPARHRVEVIARDPAQREVARDRLLLNAAPPRFAVRLLEPQPGGPAQRAVVEVDVPAGERLERLELFVNELRVATLRQPPFVRPLPPLPAGRTSYVRAVATLASGAAMEDLAVVGNQAPVDRVEVRLVELYASVLDAQGRSITGLTAADFTVYEDGEPQPLVRFDTVKNLALSVTLLMDVSASMRRKVEVAAASARRFFETVLTPKDRASLLTFNHDLERVVPFTNDVDRLRYGTIGLRPYGTTRLHDGVIYAAHGFGGRQGKRALVVLSDGQDVDSDFTFPQVLAFALRAGVAVYPILLDLADETTQADLERLAQETGGRFFAVAGVGELDGVYRQIEEDLRSQYLLVYRPPAAGERAFRRVEVELPGRPELRARTIHGYYP
ncbi:MAG: VWA domain-containing protein [Acidobacteria bacterium]|nr:MAG: VWA domain-containing protein [Acidobacteriota bacterium]